MAVLETIGSLAGSGLAGGIIGLLGSFGGKYFAAHERKIANQHEINMLPERAARRDADAAERRENYAHELALHKMNIDAADAETERAYLIGAQAISGQGLGDSIDAQEALTARPGGSQWVIDVLRLVRPVLTLVLALVMYAIYAQAPEPQQIIIVKALTFCAVAAILWWFGDRAPSWLSKALGGA